MFSPFEVEVEFSLSAVFFFFFFFWRTLRSCCVVDFLLDWGFEGEGTGERANERLYFQLSSCNPNEGENSFDPHDQIGLSVRLRWGCGRAIDGKELLTAE